MYFRNGESTEVRMNGVGHHQEPEVDDWQYDRQQSAPTDDRREIVRETQEKEEVAVNTPEWILNPGGVFWTS